MDSGIPRPSVKVTQEFASASPVLVTPQLVACNIAPFFEIIEVLTADGTVNSDSKYEAAYDQDSVDIPQLSFPSPRGNIDEVNVLEETIRSFFDFGGKIVELQDSEAYLTSFLEEDVATQPFVMEDTVIPTLGLDLDGRTLILHVDSHTAVPLSDSYLPTSKNVTITFEASAVGELVTLQEILDSINALFTGLASEGDTGKLHLQSTKFGAGASVVVRAEGTANTLLGFDSATDTVAVGSGFYATDDSDGDALSPRLKVYEGSSQKLLSDPDATVIVAPNFLDASIEDGDYLYADGVSIGAVYATESSQLTMEVEQAIMTDDAPFAPKRVWVQAKNLEYPAPGSSYEAAIEGTLQTAPASVAWVVAQTAGAFNIGASESFSVNVSIDGVAIPTETVSSGAGWADIDAVIAGIDSGLSFEGFRANDVGDEDPLGTYLGLRTKSENAGSGASITIIESTVTTELGFTVLPVGDVGENIRFLDGSRALAISSGAVSSAVALDTVVYTPTVLGVAKAEKTITWSAGLVTLDDVVDDWNAQAEYTEAFKGTSLGVESSTGTYFCVRTRGENVGLTASFTISATDAATTLSTGVYAGSDDTSLHNKVFNWAVDLNAQVNAIVLISDEDDGGVSLQQVIDKINEETTGLAAASADSPPLLSLTSPKTGEGSKLVIGDGTANDGLGFLEGADAVGGGRPDPDMAITTSGSLLVQSQLLRDSLTGLPYAGSTSPLYVTYRGLRLDLSPEAAKPGLSVFTDPDDVEDRAGPISPENPAALMAYLSLLNAPTTTVSAIGVPEVSADAPEGTPLGYAKCAEFLESEEVYALAIGTHSSVVNGAFSAHVTAMSAAEQHGERIIFTNPEVPDRANPTAIGSGTDVNSTENDNEVVLEVNIAPALIEAGIDPNSDINPTTGEIINPVYLDLAGDDNYYLVQSVVNGTTVTLRTMFDTEDGNSDSFYSTDALDSAVISDDWSVFIRGDKLFKAGTEEYDLNAVSDTIKEAAQSIGNRRHFWTFPDAVSVNVGGLEQEVPGYFGAACVIGMITGQPVQQNLSTLPVTGLASISGSDDRFNNAQLDNMAGGGVFTLVQANDAAPVTVRHSLSTDTSSLEKRELLVTKVVDYASKFYRKSLSPQMGRNNITPTFLDIIATLVDGIGVLLVESKVLVGVSTESLEIGTTADSIKIKLRLDVPMAANYTDLTLVI